MIYVLFQMKKIFIYHLDIKPLNILIVEKYNIKLSDFGESR